MDLIFLLLKTIPFNHQNRSEFTRQKPFFLHIQKKI